MISILTTVIFQNLLFYLSEIFVNLSKKSTKSNFVLKQNFFLFSFRLEFQLNFSPLMQLFSYQLILKKEIVMDYLLKLQ